jgi:hypothetical protein
MDFLKSNNIVLVYFNRNTSDPWKDEYIPQLKEIANIVFDVRDRNIRFMHSTDPLHAIDTNAENLFLSLNNGTRIIPYEGLLDRMDIIRFIEMNTYAPHYDLNEQSLDLVFRKNKHNLRTVFMISDQPLSAA